MTSTTAPSSRLEYRLAFARLVLMRADARGDYLSVAFEWAQTAHADIAERAAFTSMNALRIFLYRHKPKYAASNDGEFSALFTDLPCSSEGVRHFARITSVAKAERESREWVRDEHIALAKRLRAAVDADPSGQTLDKLLTHYAELLATV